MRVDDVVVLRTDQVWRDAIVREVRSSTCVIVQLKGTNDNPYLPSSFSGERITCKWTVDRGRKLELAVLHETFNCPSYVAFGLVSNPDHFMSVAFRGRERYCYGQEVEGTLGKVKVKAVIAEFFRTPRIGGNSYDLVAVLFSHNKLFSIKSSELRRYMSLCRTSMNMY